MKQTPNQNTSEQPDSIPLISETEPSITRTPSSSLIYQIKSDILGLDSMDFSHGGKVVQSNRVHFAPATDDTKVLIRRP